MSNQNKRYNKRPRNMMSSEKANDFKGTLKTLISYLSVYKVRIAFVIVFAIGSTVFSIVGPKILGNATTEIFNGLVSKISGGKGIDFNKIGQILTMLIGLYIVSALFSYVQSFIMTDISQKFTYNLRKSLSEKIDKMPVGYFETQTHGEVLSRITNDVDTLSQSLNQSLIQIITSFCSIIGSLVMMLSISWQMTLVAVLILPFSMAIISFVIKRSQGYFKQQQSHLGHVNGQVEEVYGGQNIVKVFNGEDEAINSFSKENEQLYQSAWKSQFFSGIMQPIMSFVGNIGYVGVSILGGYLAIKGTITVGNIQSFIQYTRSFTMPIGQIAQVSNMLQSAVASAERIFEFLSEKEEVQTVPNPVSINGLKGNVEFKNVNFGYTPDRTIINNFNANIKDGQTIAIVGPTGAGKTTIVKLLMRFYDVNNGAILVDGHNIKDFNRRDLRKMFGMVLQDTWLFNGTIMDNIRYGRLDATDEEVIAAAKAAYVHHFIQTLPEGYNMVLNEESTNISQGQKQLLTIARAILANPEILILDEATSSVDTRTELRIQKAMQNLMKGRTTFAIAHRLSTIRDADLILVMNNGDIVEQGTHEQLLKANGFYTSIYNSQFESAEVI
ncbi:MULTISPECIES: ABC transporter ATP-binding protein [Tissierellales]|jgi:ATP-binding cassette subfamily B protein|uniref:ABC transporter ATP-binding protein n=1 Tax=Acidilutibacter cellobiosedens TaxID=2507161 RepID=A0A410QCU6_9FIRM|nr:MULTISPECIES: ABC transporter ATP-binding protein [Tissierellales]QAT61810.1 ABC transporter ATP-binding protein [Acidilutibacter cellobiosedens]SCL82065.1 putative ABC transporter ATP-binding protein [Sporanaerobacter sp. PP17-6a]